MRGAVLHVVVEQHSTEDTPFIIENHTDSEIVVNQTDVIDFSLVLPPLYFAPFAWGIY